MIGTDTHHEQAGASGPETRPTLLGYLALPAVITAVVFVLALAWWSMD